MIKKLDTRQQMIAALMRCTMPEPTGDQAVWNIDDWLVSNLLPMFQKLKNERLGVPINMYRGEEGWADELAEKRWDNILSEIIHGLKCAKEVQDGNVGRSDPLTKHNVERAFNLIGKHLFDLWD